MTLAQQHITSKENLFALDAMKGLDARPNFPENLLPGHALLSHELGQFSRFKTHILFVLRNLLAIGINEDLHLLAHKNLRQIAGEQCRALGAQLQLRFFATRMIDESS